MDCYMGTILTFAFNFTPMNFAACNGQLMQIQQNSALYSLLGIAFGGNGTTNFNLPDLRGRTPVNAGQGAYPIPLTNRPFAGAYGQDNETLTIANLPVHNHAIGEKTAGQTVTVATSVVTNASDAQAGLPKPTSNYCAKPWNGTAATLGYNNTKNVTMASDAVQVTVTPTFNATNLAIGNTGASAGFPVAQPSLALNFCICTAGIYPTRT